MASNTVYLPTELDRAVRQAVDNGEYEKMSKAIQAAVSEHFKVDGESK